jgi:ubiquinone/menaquinone biosynthesis C-methylase UbiE
MPSEGYAPGWSADAVAMMGSRTADERAAFALRLLSPGARVLDAGCGPGTITRGLADAVGPAGEVLGIDAEASQVALANDLGTELATGNLRFEQASIYELPLEDGTVDVAFSHGLFEHLAHPDRALRELYRVLRPGGALAVASSDWSGAVLAPRTKDVETALEGHYRLRRRAGGDPFAGGELPGLVREAGFTDVEANAVERTDLGYAAIARYVAARLTAALAEVPELADAQRAAERWSTRQGEFRQRWVEVTARKRQGWIPNRPPE